VDIATEAGFVIKEGLNFLLVDGKKALIFLAPKTFNRRSFKFYPVISPALNLCKILKWQN